MGDYRFTPEAYESIADEIPDYEELQARAAAATGGVRAARILDLGVGTGATARRVLELHPEAVLVGIDESPEMLAAARAELPGADLREGRLEDPLPDGPFDVVVSALAVHHLDANGKRDLFARVRDVVAPGGVFVLADVVVPKRPEDGVTPLTAGFDLPDPVDDQLAWLDAAGLPAEVVWERRDLAVLRATR
ncbi:MAG TPA: class I SAM-dependent methyltransferase [Gaiellaceae bacterium]